MDKFLGKHASVPYNPDIARSFFYAGNIEAWGSGIGRIMDAFEQHGCLEPVFDFSTNGLMLNLGCQTKGQQTLVLAAPNNTEDHRFNGCGSNAVR